MPSRQLVQPSPGPPCDDHRFSPKRSPKSTSASSRILVPSLLTYCKISLTIMLGIFLMRPLFLGSKVETVFVDSNTTSHLLESNRLTVKFEPRNCNQKYFRKGILYDQRAGNGYHRTEKAVAPSECCQVCEDDEECTHWTWSKSSCLLQHGKLGSQKERGGNSTVVSARVNLDTFVERINAPQQFKKDEHHEYRLRIPERSPVCSYADEDRNLPSTSLRPQRFVILHEAWSGSDWIRQMFERHPAAMLQFEIDLSVAGEALQCKYCRRYTMHGLARVQIDPSKTHPPLACGMTLFGSANRYVDVTNLVSSHDAKLVILLRKNHVAHAVALHVGSNGNHHSVNWSGDEFLQSVDDALRTYERLLKFAARVQAQTHFVYYEDIAKNLNIVWAALNDFLGLPAADLGKTNFVAPDRELGFFLENLAALQAVAAGEEWREMATDPHFNERLDVAAEFLRACSSQRGNTTAGWSWRGGRCPS